MEEEINYDIMRYDLDEQGYISNIYWGCASGTCTAYTGTIPEGYETLERWSSEANIRAYKLVDGNLTYDANRDVELQALYEQQNIDNSYVTHKEIYGLQKEIEDIQDVNNSQYTTATASGKIITIDNVKKVYPKIKLTNITAISKIDLITTGKNILTNEALSYTINGVTFVQNNDKSIIIDGTSTAAIEYNIAGTSDNTSAFLCFKKGLNYYLSSNGYEIKMYNFDGTDRTQVYSGSGGNISFTDSDKLVTQIVLCIPNGTTLNNVTISPQLELGTSASAYETYKSNKMTIDFTDYTGTIEYILIDNRKAYIKVTGNEEEFNVDQVHLFDGYNIVYAIQDIDMEIEYCINNLKLEGTITKNNNFKVLEDGSIQANNGYYSGTIEADTGDIGGWDIDATSLSCDIKPPSDYTTADTDRISAIILGETPTAEDYAKYDLNNDGEIDILDFRICSRLIEYNLKNSTPGKVKLDTSNFLKPIRILNSSNEEIASLGAYSSVRDLDVNGSLSINGNVSANVGYLYSILNGITNQIGSQNTYYCHYNTNASSGHWFNKNTYVQGEVYAGSNFNDRLVRLSELNNKLIDSYSTNSNNGYIRFTNGIQIAWKSMQATIGGTLWTNNIYYSDHSLGNWGAAFTSLFLAFPWGNTTQHWFSLGGETPTSAGTLRGFRPNNGKVTVYCGAIGIGYWK